MRMSEFCGLTKTDPGFESIVVLLDKDDKLKVALYIEDENEKRRKASRINGLQAYEGI